MIATQLLKKLYTGGMPDAPVLQAQPAAQASADAQAPSAPSIFQSAPHPVQPVQPAADRVRVVGYNTMPSCPALIDLAVELAEKSDVCGEFLHTLNRAYDNSGDHTFSYDMNGLSVPERQQLIGIANDLIGFIRFHVDMSAGYIKGSVATASPVIGRFLKGAYLEMALCAITQKTVRTIAERRGLSYSVETNALITNGHSYNECDVLIRLGNETFVVESKSGRGSNVEYEKYYKIADTYSLLPDHLLMVCNDLSPQNTELIHFLYSYFVVPTKGYEAALKKMLGEQEENV